VKKRKPAQLILFQVASSTNYSFRLSLKRKDSSKLRVNIGLHDYHFWWKTF